MYKLFYRSSLLLLIIFSYTAFASSASGNIEGRVKDAQTGEALIGVNVVLKNTSMGAASNESGRYYIRNVAAGKYTIRASYIGYNPEEFVINVKDGKTVEQDFKLEPVGVKGQTVEVTAQASGQNSAINQQLESDKIINVVSAARIQELPDANAAESVGRLPGVYLLRAGGEGYEVSIQGLEPKYNKIMIDGVEMPGSSSSDRSVDLSMISSNMLSNIEVYKTVTPDMDAAVLGGEVNFGIREAKQTTTNAPEIEFSSQGGYNGLQNKAGDFKFSSTIGNRFLDGRLGILAQGVVEDANLTSDQLNAGYTLLTFNLGALNKQRLVNLVPAYEPSDRRRYDATLTIDYKLPHGVIDFMNFFSSGDTKTETRDQAYGLFGNSITYDAGYSTNRLNVLTNLLDFKQNVFSVDIDLRLSNAYTENIAPQNWDAGFVQTIDLSKIPFGEDPVLIAKAVDAKTNLHNMFLENLITSNSYFKHRDLTGSLDLKKTFNISDLITTTLKMGGVFKYGNSYYNYDQASGNLDVANSTNLRLQILNAFPWMTQPPYSIAPDGTQSFPITLFKDPNFRYGNFLGGSYAMGTATNLSLISQMVNIVKNSKYQPNGGYLPDEYQSGASDYTGSEYENAGYVMATLKIGPQITLIPGVRYQGLETYYQAPIYLDAGEANPYPSLLQHRDTTINEYHGYWLPSLNLIYRPFTWLDVHAAYTNTISYPDPSQITPQIDVIASPSTERVIWNNFALKPARSQNYDLSLSMFSNSIGLFAVNGFLKQIDDLIFGTGSGFVIDPSRYAGIPSYTKGFGISTSINDPYRVNMWGIELEWQTHFWYLPSPLNGIVFNINFTHIFSGAQYPYTISYPGVYPTYIPTHVDTFYTDRMIDQPDNMVNLSVGYDYAGFSLIVSMIYQANIFSYSNFWPELRQNKAEYLRWDLALKQNLPWIGLQAFLQFNNINSANDTYQLQGSGFPTSESDYGMTANLGLRWSLQ
ncbi:MAG: TonB-dependent receptor [Ignavibacteriaceae bacterium]